MTAHARNLPGALRDIVSALEAGEIRALVGYYYDIQVYRISLGNQIRSLRASGGEPQLAPWLFEQLRAVEHEVQTAMDLWTQDHVVGRWSRTIVGIGPVLAAGLLAHIDIERAPTVGHIWAYAGLDPSRRWERGKPRPWNAQLKTICWRIGRSFVLHRAHPHCFYGQVYAERKALEESRNARGEYAEQARAALEERRIQDAATRKIYEQGKLPPGRIDLRARRYAVKLFLAHWHHVAYESRYGCPPPRPYVIEHLGHAHYLRPPNWSLPR